jgi:hypothetical protein
VVTEESFNFFPSKFTDSLESIHGSQREGKLGIISKANLSIRWNYLKLLFESYKLRRILHVRGAGYLLRQRGRIVVFGEVKPVSLCANTYSAESLVASRGNINHRFKADSHIPCRSLAMPRICRSESDCSRPRQGRGRWTAWYVWIRIGRPETACERPARLRHCRRMAGYVRIGP